MEFLRERRNLPVIIGGAVALLAGVGVALGLVWSHRGETPPPAPASRGGLVIEAGKADDAKQDSTQLLRCFVNGVFVAELTLVECAKRNGVATVALDVGVDDSGKPATAGPAGQGVRPPPPAPPGPAPVVAPAAVAAPQVTGSNPAPAGPCWRYADGDWRKLPADLTLDACIQALFAGRCERPGGQSYGRWMQQTLRLSPGRLEVSGDNRRFRALAEQTAGCAIPPLG